MFFMVHVFPKSDIDTYIVIPHAEHRAATEFRGIIVCIITLQNVQLWKKDKICDGIA